MNKALEHYLKNDWELVRTTLRWHYIRNRKKSPHLRGQGLQTSRIVRTWYEPIYLWARARMHSRHKRAIAWLLGERYSA